MASRSGNRSGSSKNAATPNEIIINVGTGETRVGLLENKSFVELHIERDRDSSVASMVAKGKVTRVLLGLMVE